MLTRRAILPLFGAIPVTRWPIEIVPRAKETRIVFGGDVMLSRFVGRLARERRDPALPMRDLAPYFAAADIAFVNLESPFSDRGRPVEKGMVFKAEPEMIGGLELAGIDVVSTANNHARDGGEYGIEFTLDWLEKHGIAAAGSGRSEEAAHSGVVLERNGLRFGFLAYTFDQSNGNYTDFDERIAVLDVARMRRDVAAMRTRADVVIVSMHAGIEYAARPNQQQVAFAHAAIDAGARVVVGHHPHVVQPWERYGSGVIYYSLGNLVFDQFQRAETQRGALGQVDFSGAAVARAALLPVTIVRTVPRFADASRV
ncbi:MAG TPA: CapA family protein [Bryobacteraceae bacterium]|nr:CapA family protein [Bryobacteraceae bacterium]